MNQKENTSDYVPFNMPKERILPQVSDSDLLAEMSRRNLHAVLAQIPSAVLRQALRVRKVYEDEQINKKTFRYNVLDLNLSQLIKHCWDHKLINREQYRTRTQSFRFTDHPKLGWKLVKGVPDQYYVGGRSTHYQLSRAHQLEKLYGIYKQNNEEIIYDDADSDYYMYQDDEQMKAQTQNENKRCYLKNKKNIDTGMSGFLVPDSQSLSGQNYGVNGNTHINCGNRHANYCMKKERRKHHKKIKKHKKHKNRNRWDERKDRSQSKNKNADHKVMTIVQSCSDEEISSNFCKEKNSKDSDLIDEDMPQIWKYLRPKRFKIDLISLNKYDASGIETTLFQGNLQENKQSEDYQVIKHQPDYD